MKRPWMFGGLIGSFVLSACASEEASDTVAAAFHVEEIARFGSQFGDGSGLTRVSALVPTSSELFVLESQPARVAVFSLEGAWLRDVGRSGEGPGEFRRPVTIGVRDGLLWIGDPSGGRVEFFTLEGEHEGSVRWALPADSLGTPSVPIGVLSDGSILGGPANLSVGAVVTGALTHRNYYRATEAGTDQARLYVEDVVSTDFMSAEAPGGGILMGANPHRQSPLVKPYPDGSGIVIVDRYVAPSPEDSSFRITSIDPRGATMAEWSVSYRPVPAVKWRERYMAEMEERMLESTGSVDRAFLAAIDGGLPDLAFYPPVTEAVAGTDGSVWIRREDTGGDTATWNVFSGDGELAGTLTLPPGLRVLRASLNEVWVVEVDEFDVPFVVHMRVVPG
jgi:6-bladed beta-propeller